MSIKKGRFDDVSEMMELESEIERVELKELQDMVDEGYPSDAKLARYEELARKLDPDRLNIVRGIEDDSPRGETITRWEHEDRFADDRLANSVYDGSDEKELEYMSLGKSVSYATKNFKWIKQPSPFIKGDKEYNRKVYLFLKDALENRKWIKISGVSKKVLVNYLQVWIAIPEWMKEKGVPSLATNLTVFVFGTMVNDYREAVIRKFPQHFPRTPHIDTNGCLEPVLV